MGIKTIDKRHPAAVVGFRLNKSQVEQDSPGHNFIVNFYNAVWITGSGA